MASLDGAWSAEDTTPAEVEAALGRLLSRHHAEHGRFAPARVINLVVVVDAARRAEVVERLEQVGRYHPSRTIVCALSPGRRTLAAVAAMVCERPAGAGGLALCRERIELELGEAAASALASVVDPLLVHDLETLAWCPHGHAGALEALGGLASSVLVDSSEDPTPAGGLAAARRHAARARVVDLAWLRGAPWRERLAALFDPPEWRPALAEISRLAVDHHPRSATSALLLAGWLGSRLGWEPTALADDGGALRGRVRRPGGEVEIVLRVDAGLAAPGLGRVAMAAPSGLGLRLERGAGGLSAWRRTPDGDEATWTVLGASRGEAGILGEGIRQALLRSSLYGPALELAARLAS
jgi:glucose-6-phosphate dehydrogenase assembly protein OpcA